MFAQLCSATWVVASEFGWGDSSGDIIKSEAGGKV